MLAPSTIPVRAIALLAFAAFSSQAMVRVSDPLLPQIAEDFSVTVGGAAAIVTSYAVGHGLSQVFIGVIGRRFGNYRAVAISCALSAILVFACGLMPTLPTLTTMRFLSGCVGGWIVALGISFIGDVTPYEKRQPVLGRYVAGVICGLLFGQAAGGILADLVGWRAMFFVLAGFFALAAAGLFLELRRNPLTRASRDVQVSRGFFADFATVLSNPWARVVIFTVFVEGAIFFGVFAYAGADLHLRFGLSLTQVGLIVGTLAIGGLTYVTSVTVLLRYFSQRGMVVTGFLVISACYFALAAGLAWWVAIPAITLCGVGIYMVHNTLQTFSTQMSPTVRGTAIAALGSTFYLGQSLGAAGSAYIFDHFGGPPLFAGAAALMIAFSLWFAAIARRVQPAGKVD